MKTTMMTTAWGSMPMMMMMMMIIMPKDRKRTVRFRLCVVPLSSIPLSQFNIHYNADDDVFYEEDMDMEIGVEDDDEDDEAGDVDDEFYEGTWNITLPQVLDYGVSLTFFINPQQGM